MESTELKLNNLIKNLSAQFEQARDRELERMHNHRLSPETRSAFEQFSKRLLEAFLRGPRNCLSAGVADLSRALDLLEPALGGELGA